MSPPDLGLRDETITKYCELLRALDCAVYLGEAGNAGECHGALVEFVNKLPSQERVSLDLHFSFPGWPSKRRRRLKTRWEALQLHGGSWRGWCGQLHETAQGSQSHRREALREAAKDLVYAKPPGEHRAALWRFCAAGGAPSEATETALAGNRAAPSRDSPPANEKDRAQFEQMLLDVWRTPHLEPGQEDVLVSILVAHCSHRSTAAGTLFDTYVQGMHMLAACPLWAGLGSADALLVFEFVLQRLCCGYFSDTSFFLFKRDVLVVEALIEERLPHLAAALRQANVPMMSIAFDPLLCLFTYHLPSVATLRLWDVLLLEGDTAIFTALLVLLEEMLPEAVNPAVTQTKAILKWDGFPFVECLHERLAALTVDNVEAMLGRIRGQLQSLRRRVHELRTRKVPKSEASMSEIRSFKPGSTPSKGGLGISCAQM